MMATTTNPSCNSRDSYRASLYSAAATNLSLPPPSDVLGGERDTLHSLLLRGINYDASMGLPMMAMTVEADETRQDEQEELPVPPLSTAAAPPATSPSSSSSFHQLEPHYAHLARILDEAMDLLHEADGFLADDDSITAATGTTSPSSSSSSSSRGKGTVGNSSEDDQGSATTRSSPSKH